MEPTTTLCFDRSMVRLDSRSKDSSKIFGSDAIGRALRLRPVDIHQVLEEQAHDGIVEDRNADRITRALAIDFLAIAHPWCVFLE